MVGIIQEQHPDRARLFMQWKEMGWPILVDSLNLLNVSVVPVTLAIDEHGIIRLINPKRELIEQEFLAKTYPQAARASVAESMPPHAEDVEAPGAAAPASAWRAYGDALFRWHPPTRLTDVIAAYQRTAETEPDHGPTHFRLGVAYRARYDSEHRQPNDFLSAVDHWERALDIDPNNYIWRRRIQQYGPRLEKPYPFYDWVTTARAEIEARGETPAPLVVEPGGAEFAQPADTFETTGDPQPEPDPANRILHDLGEFIQTEAVMVPTTVAPGGAARAHVVFRPNLERKAHWNNEVDDLVFWVSAAAGWQVDNRYRTVGRPPEVVSQEARQIEFEVRSPKDAGTGRVVIPGYALYYVCEDVDGTCLYRRQDVELELVVRD